MNFRMITAAIATTVLTVLLDHTRRPTATATTLSPYDDPLGLLVAPPAWLVATAIVAWAWIMADVMRR